MNNINDLRLNNNISNTNKSQIPQELVMEFAKMLKNEIDDLNKAQESGEAAMTDIATGQVKDLHQAAIAITKAESSMNLC